MDYASIVYHDLGVVLNIKLQRMQNACVRFITSTPRDAHITPMYVEIGWLKLKERRQYAIAILLTKIMRTSTPAYIFENIKPMKMIHHRNNRHTSHMLQIPHHRSVKCSSSFTITSSSLWNSLNLGQYMNRSIPSLKRILHSHFLSLYS